jgi:hypothetical protein
MGWTERLRMGQASENNNFLILTLGLLATITLRLVPFHAYSSPFPGLLTCFKCILEVMLCEGVQHFLDHLNCVRVEACQFYLQSGTQKKKSQGTKSGDGDDKGTVS